MSRLAVEHTIIQQLAEQSRYMLSIGCAGFCLLLTALFSPGLLLLSGGRRAGSVCGSHSAHPQAPRRRRLKGRFGSVLTARGVAPPAAADSRC